MRCPHIRNVGRNSTLAKKPVGVTKVEDAEGKQKALDAVLGLINKNYGAGAVQKLGEATGLDVESISLGAPSLDMALGIGGIPAGRVVEIYGPESSGKTTVALQAVASVQKAGGTAAFIDAEHALDPVYAANLGVDIDSLLVSQPDTGEQALEIMDMLVGSGAVDIVVVDSVAALVPRAEIEGDMGDSHVGLQARMMSQALRKITGRLSSTGTTAIFINQLREKIGVFFGNPETTTGGKALKFYASVRIDIRRVTTIKDKAGNSIGNRTRAKIVKNKVAPPFKMAEFEITYGKGVDTTGNILSMAIEQDIVKQSGAWYSYPPGNREKETPNKMFLQGEEACKKWFKDPANYEAVLEIGNKVAATYMPDRKYVAYAAEFDDPVIDYDPETYHDPNAVGGLVDTETGEVDDDFLSGLE
jgi:recombination protein RecA